VAGQVVFRVSVAADSTNAALASAAGVNVADTLTILTALADQLVGGLSATQAVQSVIQGTGVVVNYRPPNVIGLAT
jgi:3-hydroxyisobutyrate dehydrogenase-like beta-hydroxyacid dehydrogenase